MKASELIEQLNQLKAEHGDCQIGLYDDTENEFSEIDSVLPRVQGGMDRTNFDGVFFGITTYEIGDWLRQLKYKNDPEIRDIHYANKGK